MTVFEQDSCLYVVPKSMPMQHPFIFSDVSFFSSSPPLNRKISANLVSSSAISLFGFLSQKLEGPKTDEQTKPTLVAAKINTQIILFISFCHEINLLRQSDRNLWCL